MTQENTTATTVATTENLPQAPEQIQSGWTSLVPMVLIFVVFYFLLIRPQEKKRKAQEQLVSTVKPGEEIITHSGIYGKVVKVNENDNTISVEIAKNIEVKLLKSAVGDIISRKPVVAAKPVTKVAESSAKSALSKPAASSTKSIAETAKKPSSVSKKVVKSAVKKAAKTKPVTAKKGK